MQDPSETFYTARNNVISMLIDRGYLDEATRTTEALQKRYTSYDEFKKLYQVGGVAMDLAGIVTPENIPVYVKFVPDELIAADLYKDGAGLFNDIATSVFELPKFKHDENRTSLRAFFQSVKLIVVFVASRNNKNKFVNTIEKSYTIPEYANIELWPVHRLQCNYARHLLVRPHTILSEVEKQALLHRFNLNISMMPEMCVDDPLNRWYNGLPGDVYRIDMGTAPTYRVVVSRKMPISKAN
jgi:DNA-directed RNA polymerase subunit H (RpoH/RPB5)